MTAYFKLRTGALLSALCAFLAGCTEERERINTSVLYVAAGTQETSALAAFYGDIFGANRCTRDFVGQCEIATCLDGGAIRKYVDGGEVEFIGNELQTTLDTGKVLDDDGNEAPGFASAEALPALSDNEEIAVKVHGRGTVSTTEGKITMPTRLELTEPALLEPSCQGVDPDTVDPISVVRGDNFSVRWSSDQSDDVDVLFFFDDIADYEGDPSRERFTQIRCLYTAADEFADIPDEVVGRMPAGVTGTFSVRQIVSNAKLVGDWSITFGGFWELCSPVVAE